MGSEKIAVAFVPRYFCTTLLLYHVTFVAVYFRTPLLLALLYSLRNPFSHPTCQIPPFGKCRAEAPFSNSMWRTGLSTNSIVNPPAALFDGRKSDVVLIAWESIQDGREGWWMGHNKHKTFNQETGVCVPCETKSNVDLFCHVSC